MSLVFRALAERRLTTTLLRPKRQLSSMFYGMNYYARGSDFAPVRGEGPI